MGRLGNVTAAAARLALNWFIDNFAEEYHRKANISAPLADQTFSSFAT